MKPETSNALWIGGIVLGAAAIIGAVTYVASKPAAASTTPSPTPTPLPGHSQYPVLTLQSSNMSVDTSQYASTGITLAAPTGGTIVSIKSGRITAAENMATVSFGPPIASGKTLDVVWKSAAGQLFNMTVSFT